MSYLAEQTVKWTALGNEALVALLGGVGIVAAAGLIIVGISRANQARQAGAPGSAAAGISLATVGAILCLCALVVGFIAMVHKSS